MSYNGSGVFVVNSSGQPVVASTLITSAAFNAYTSDAATGMSNAICKDGQTTITANIPLSTFKLTGVGDGTLKQDAATLNNIQSGTGVYIGTVGGTADVITLTASPAITAYVAGQAFRFIASGANTTNVTVAVSGLAAKAITKNGTTALVAGDLPSGAIITIIYDGTRFQVVATSGNFATLTGSEVLTNKTLTSPIINTGTVGAAPTADLGIANKAYADKTVAAYSSTDTLAAGVGLALLSGASFVFTLPAAASNTNREVTILHQGTSLTQVYTVKGNSAESVIAQDATANTYLLYTNGEEVTLKCDGTSWYVRNHHAKTEWVDAGAMTITGTGGNPTKPNTPDIDKVYWRRDGSRVFLRYILQISAATGGVDGTGAYLFALPTNITMDTTVLTPVATALSAAVRSEASASYLDGRGVAQIDSVSMGSAVFFAYDTSHFQAWRDRDGTDSAVGSASCALSNAELSFNFELNLRAANWRL